MAARQAPLCADHQSSPIRAVSSQSRLAERGDGAGGATNRHIARALGISLKAVQNHVSRILDKLQAADRTQAALRARGLALPPH